MLWLKVPFVSEMFVDVLYQSILPQVSVLILVNTMEASAQSTDDKCMSPLPILEMEYHTAEKTLVGD